MRVIGDCFGSFLKFRFLFFADRAPRSINHHQHVFGFIHDSFFESLLNQIVNGGGLFSRHLLGFKPFFDFSVFNISGKVVHGIKGQISTLLRANVFVDKFWSSVHDSDLWESWGFGVHADFIGFFAGEFIVLVQIDYVLNVTVSFHLLCGGFDFGEKVLAHFIFFVWTQKQVHDVFSSVLSSFEVNGSWADNEGVFVVH